MEEKCVILSFIMDFNNSQIPELISQKPSVPAKALGYMVSYRPAADFKDYQAKIDFKLA